MSNTLPLRYREGISAFAATVLVNKRCYEIFQKYANEDGAVDFSRFMPSSDSTDPNVVNFMMMMVSIFGGPTAISGEDDETLFAFPVDETQFAVNLIDDLGNLEEAPVRMVHITMRHPVFDTSDEVTHPTLRVA